MRVGIGNDVHRLVRGRRLVLGGVEIPHEKGLEGHSDADVLVHAVCDALLGAAGLGDIGHHFPDSDPAYRDVFSIRLLERTRQIVGKTFPRIYNVDATVFAEAPRLAPYREKMTENIATALELPADCVNIKATTTEGLDFIGRGEGIAAMCIVMIGA